jgi:hypothetical protein
MDLFSFRTLLTPAGQEALQEAQALEPNESNFLRDFSALSRRYPAEVARAALETAILRNEAAAKFPFAGRMYFTREALEQASAYEVSNYRAERFRPYQRLADLGCSIGGDTLALAGIAPTLGVDRDPLRLAIAQANLRAADLGEPTSFIQADLTAPLPFSLSPLHPSSTAPLHSNSLALFFDPARRAGGRRIYSVRDYLPPLDIVQDWLPTYPALGVKISPGVDLTEIEGHDGEVEFISLEGELKEAVLWFGPLKTASRRATVLPGRHTLSVSVEETKGMPQLPIREPQAYLYEPDPAILRAGLVAALGIELQAAQLDPDIAYMTSENETPTPFARVWAVEDWLPFNLKRLRATLRERGVGQVVVKKRGSPLQPETLIRDLRLWGDQERVIFLTHLRGRPVVVICMPERKGSRGSLFPYSP